MSSDTFENNPRLDQPASKISGAFRKAIWISISLVLTICLFDLVGWRYNIAVFKSILLSGEPMKLITASCFFVSVLAIIIVLFNFRKLIWKVITFSSAMLICLISILSLYVHLFTIINGYESPVSQLPYFRLFLPPGERMAILTACNFLFLGITMFLLRKDKMIASGLAHVIFIPVFLVSYFTIISYILGVSAATELNHVAVALNTGIAFCAICVVILLIRPDTWLMKVFNSSEIAGIISRKLLPPLAVLPIIIGWLRIYGERIGLMRSEVGVVLVAIAYTFCFIILIWLLARSIEKIDRKRRSMEDELKESEERFRAIAETVPVLVCVTRTEDSIVLFTNEVNNKAFGLKGENILGTKGPDYYCDPADREKMIEVLKEQGVVNNYQLKVKKSDGSPFWIMTSISPIDYYGQPAMIGASIDITEYKKFEESLRLSEDRFRTIAESLPVLISITRIDDSTIAFLNEPFEKSFGYSKADLLGKKLPDIYYYPNDFACLVDLLKVKGFIENMEFRVKRTDGTSFWIMTSIRKIRFMNEPSYLCTSIDITESKRTQEELLRLNRVLNAKSKSTQTMMHSNNEFNYLRDVCKIIIGDCGYSMVWIGYAGQDKKVKPVASYGFDKGYIDQIDITWDDTERGRGPTGTAIRTGKLAICRNMLTDPLFEPWRKAAIERGYASSLVLPLLSDGKSFGAISIYSKETDPFTESEISLLSEMANDLSYGVSFMRLAESERTAVRILKESEAKLKELVATKDKFFNIIAHDLKNPFTSLLGSSELLYSNIDKISTENIRDLSLVLNDSAKGGYAILQNLLDWSRSQTGLLKFNPEKINLKFIIDENIDNLQLQVLNKGITLRSELTEDLLIRADKNMINTVVRNLLSNAIKYTFKNGSVTVSVTKYPEELILAVKDTGIGISKEKVEALFKLDNSLSQPGTEKEQGTGLGLKLCKEFTERMGGRIWVESKAGKGSEFKFTIPVA
jgi:PAS domain S-box-containing protein